MYVLLLISVVFSALVMFGPTVTEGAFEIPAYTGTVLSWTIIMIFGALAITIIFEIFNIILHPASAKQTLLSALGIAVLLVISWFMADGTPLQIIGYEGVDNVPFTLKLTDTGLFAFYALFVASVVVIITTEVSRIFK